MPNHDTVSETKKGEIITARRQTEMARAINANTTARKRPTQKDIPSGSPGGEPLGDEVFNTVSSTEESVITTDSNGDTVTTQRFTQIVLTETTSGRTMTLNISYP